MATIDLGKIKQVWRGTYNNSTAYVVDDLVAYTDSGITSTYICVANSTGNAPSSSGTAHASWNYVAKGVADPIPSQSGNAGKALITNGSAVSWGDGGAWTKIASGTGPSSAATSITIDNIFSNSYKFYKIFYSWAQDDWLKGRYIKADGSVEGGNVYLWTGQYARENADDEGRLGSTNTNYAVYSYWDGADDCPAICEINFFDPYASDRETIDHVNASMVQGTRAVWQSSMNCNMNSYSVRGIKFFGSAGDNINSTNFYYVVLGANV
jgi:hypothetical protein